MSDSASPAASVEEVIRLAVLQSSALMDSGPEASFDRYTRLAAHLLDAPVSLVSLVDDQRQYFKSHFGLTAPWATRRETPLSHSFCRHVVDRREPLVIGDAREHELVCDNPAIGELDVKAYLGIPLATREGQVLGSFCAIDSRPRQWTDREVDLMRDLAASVMTEIEFRRLSAGFISQFRSLLELEQRRDEMVQMLVHDLRNPLSSLLAGLDMVEMVDGLTDRHRKYLERAREGGFSLLEMVNEILIINRGEAGELNLKLESLVPAELVRSSLQKVSELALASEIRLVDCVSDLLPRVTADQAKMERLLVNLVSNALDHTPRGGEVRVDARVTEDGSALEFSVSDTGRGIPLDQQKRIFEKFGQASDSDRGKSNHSGLGLSFCKTVVEAHNGRISVDSAPGRGTCMRVAIPLGVD